MSKGVCTGECIDQKVVHVYRKLLCLINTVQLYILVPCGASTEVNHYEKCVLPITIFS